MVVATAVTEMFVEPTGDLLPLCPSVGSVGHPFTCSLPCKYNSKSSGCKDGKCCTRCHLCLWMRQSERTTSYAYPAMGYVGGSATDSPSGGNRTPSGGHRTPDHPSVVQHQPAPVDDESDSQSTGGQKTPLMTAATCSEIASKLGAKLQMLESLRRQDMSVISGPKLGKLMEARGLASTVPPPPLPYHLSNRAASVSPTTPLSFAPPPGLEPMQDEEVAKVDLTLMGNVPPPPAPFVATSDTSDVIVTSLGSLGHPKTCGAACRYARRKGGCRLGAQCPDCHFCQWQRERTTEQAADEAPLPLDLTSVGTQGHPHSCGQPCKYFRRKGGCRNGSSCPDCHQCMWRRSTLTTGVVGAKVVGSQIGQVGPQVATGTAFVPEYIETSHFVGTIDMGGPGLRAGLEVAPGLVMPTSSPLSVGSIGHPYTCAGVGCKYNGKSKGCKDGQLCIRCHHCEWRRYQKC